MPLPHSPADGLFVALGPSEYASGAACGSYLNVTGPNGTVRVKVVDQCPECRPGHLDLSQPAFARLAPLARGEIPVTYSQVVNPPMPALSFRVKEGSSPYWLSILAIDHGNPLTSLAVRVGSGWQPLARQEYNYWQAANGLGPGPFTLRLTDDQGHQAIVPDITLTPARVQRTTISMYGSTAPQPTTSATPRSYTRIPAAPWPDPTAPLPSAATGLRHPPAKASTPHC